jgi:hypothetical protein
MVFTARPEVIFLERITQHAPKDQGWILFRRLVPMEEARKSLDEKLLTKVPIYCGLGSAINCMPVHGGRTYQITLTAVKAAAWNETDDNELLVVLEDFYKDWIPEVQTIVKVCLFSSAYDPVIPDMSSFSTKILANPGS